MRTLASGVPASADLEPGGGFGGRKARERTIVTRMRLPFPPEEVFEELLFFEEIGDRTPLLLRLLLPTPVGTEGRKTEVGDEARCIYDTGHLVKRMTRIDRPRTCEFQIVEQALDVGRGIRLRGGGYTLRTSVRGGTELTLETRYTSPRRPRRLWNPIESAIGHAFHQHILRAMRRGLRDRVQTRKARPGYGIASTGFSE